MLELLKKNKKQEENHKTKEVRRFHKENQFFKILISYKESHYDLVEYQIVELQKMKIQQLNKLNKNVQMLLLFIRIKISKKIQLLLLLLHKSQ